ncbi:MAG: hypothetical protein ACLFRY_13290, partial [Spirochaetia bacterium]
MSFSRIILPALILFTAAASGFAQELVPEESPSALFASEIGDTDVDLFFTGFWKGSLMGSFSFGYDSDQGAIVPAVFPDFAPGFLFRQIPDLTLSLWIREKYFFETTIQEDSSLNTFMLGYRGAQDEFLRSVLIGNTGVQMGTYGFLNFPDQPSNSLGASAFMRSESTEHEVMIRYEPSETTTVTFLGNNRMEESLIGLPEYLSDRRFLLPDDDVEDLIIYIQDTEGPLTGGDGNRYRRLEPGEAYVSETDGLIEFVKPRTGRVLVYYTRGGSPVGSAGLGTGFLAGEDGDNIDITQPAVDFDFGITYLNIPPEDWGWQVPIEGNDALLIFEPGSFSPFALLNTYSLPENAPAEEWRNTCFLLPKDDRYADGSAVPISVDTGAGFFTVESEPELERIARVAGELKKTARVAIRVNPDIDPGTHEYTCTGKGDTKFGVDPETARRLSLRAIEHDALPLVWGFPQLKLLVLDAPSTGDGLRDFIDGVPALEVLELFNATMGTPDFARLPGQLPELTQLLVAPDPELAADERLGHRALRFLQGAPNL